MTLFNIYVNLSYTVKISSVANCRPFKNCNIDVVIYIQTQSTFVVKCGLSEMKGVVLISR